MLSQAAPFLIAVFIAFAADSPASKLKPGGDDTTTILVALTVILASAIIAVVIGTWLLVAARRRGWPSDRLRAGFIRGTYAVSIINLVGYAAIIHLWDWPEFVRYGLGLRRTFVLEELVIILPFIVMDIAGCWGLFPVARACHLIMTSRGAIHYVGRKTRETYGAVLPASLIFWAGSDLSRRLLGETARQTWAQLAVLAMLGSVVVLISPALVLLSFPSRPLPPGALRSRLESVARQFKFRLKNILIWDTDGSVFNARLTGTIPGFRYVLLSDALITHLDDDEIAAVFGHELGHVHHKHLLLLAVFCLGSLAVIALCAQAIDGTFRLLPRWTNGSPLVELSKLVLMLAATGVYFRLVFGPVSRILERQADVFGCRTVSGGLGEFDQKAGSQDGGAERALSRMGIKTYVDALTIVATENRVSLDQPSWRHGSIASRIHFLENLDGRPEVENRFQKRVKRLRLLVGVLFLASLTLAILSGAFDYLRAI